MNIKKGFFRLVLVLSALTGISLLYISGNSRYKIYTVKRDMLYKIPIPLEALFEGRNKDYSSVMHTYIVTDTTSGKKAELTGESPPTEKELNNIFSLIRKELLSVTKVLTVNFKWFEETEPTTVDYDAIFLADEQLRKGISKDAFFELLQKFRYKYPEYNDLSDYDLLNRLAKKYPVWKDVLKKWEKETERVTPQSKSPPYDIAKNSSFITTYTILKIEDRINWTRLVLVGGKVFVFIWFIYAFIMWVIIGFIVGGFKNKRNP